MAYQNRALVFALALASMAVAACGLSPRGQDLVMGYRPLVVTGNHPLLTTPQVLPGPLAPSADPQASQTPSSPRPLPFLTALDRAARHQERGAAELQKGNAEGAELEFHRALGLLLDPSADAFQPASYRASRSPFQPDPPLWREDPPQSSPDEADDAPQEEAEPLPPGPALITPEDVQAIERQATTPGGAPEVDPHKFDVPIVLNARVQTFIHYFSNRKYDLISRAFDRASRYLPMMRGIFREKGLPEDLLNLAFIESAFNPRARSRAAASGIWQFVERTGRRFGMRSGLWVDERRDPELSTRGAAQYLKTLYERFESWPLALAAYNAGEGKIQQAIARQKTTDFWRLRLPKETQLFVPAFMAMSIIAKDPAKYGFNPAPEQVPEAEIVHLKESFDLRTIARAAGTTPETLRDLNPTLLRGATPPSPFDLRLPPGSSEGFLERLAQLPRLKPAAVVRHRVRKGETWEALARQHRMSTQALLELNGREAVGSLKVGSMILVPGRGAARVEGAAAPAANERRPAGVQASPVRRYTIKRGDTLAKIAQAHGVHVEELLEWNGLKARQPLKPGQTLLVSYRQAAAPGGGAEASVSLAQRGSSTAPAVRPAGKAAAKTRQIRYTVKRGDTLWDIAQAHGVRPEELRRWNGLRARGRLQPGQELQILLPEAS